MKTNFIILPNLSMQKLSGKILFFILITSGLTGFSQSILWKITGPGSTSPSYILCTSEISGVENYDIVTPVNTLLDNVNTVAFYCIPDASDKQNIPTLMAAPDERTLKGYYKRDDRIRMELMVRDKLHGNIDSIYALKPLYILQLFRDKDHQNGFAYQQSVLFNSAIQKTKPTLSILTLRQIASIMDQVDFDSQAFIMSNYMANEKAVLESDALKLQFYKNQQTKEYVDELYAQEQTAYIEIYINQISDLVAKKVDALSAQQSVLYVLNTEFVAGEKGLIAKLKGKGYTVTAELIALNQQSSAQQNNSNNNITSSNNFSQAPPDGFPEIAFTTTSNTIINPEEITIIQSADITESYKNKKYAAYGDPFNDMFDYEASDTLFLESWYRMKGADANFEVRVPIKGDWESIVEDNVLGTIKQYIYQTNHAKTDLFYSIGYTVYPPTFKAGDKNTFYNDFLERSVNNIGGKPLAQRIISTPYYTGREFTAIVGDSFFVRSVFFLQDNILYQMLVGGPGDNAYSVFAEAFFHSFSTKGASISNWFLFEQPAFKCYIPTPPSKATQSYNVGSGAMNLVTYTSEDYKENITYSISVYNYPPGYKFKGKNAFYDELISNAERQYFGKAQSITKVTKNGIEGRYVVMPLMNKKTYLMYFFFDKNAVYQYIAGGEPSAIQSLNVKRFFDSFEFAGEAEDK